MNVSTPSGLGVEKRVGAGIAPVRQWGPVRAKAVDMGDEDDAGGSLEAESAAAVGQEGVKEKERTRMMDS